MGTVLNMDRIKCGTKTAEQILSVIITLAGSVIGILINEVLRKITEMKDAAYINDDVYMGFLSKKLPIRALCFAYIVPGLIGAIGFVTKKKGLYITHMVFSIITLRIMGPISMHGLMALPALATFSPNSCFADGNFCKCGDISLMTDRISCSDITQMYAMAVTIIVMTCLAWVLVLATTIISGLLLCKQNDTRPIVSAQPLPGMVPMSTGAVYQQSDYPLQSDIEI